MPSSYRVESGTTIATPTSGYSRTPAWRSVSGAGGAVRWLLCALPVVMLLSSCRKPVEPQYGRPLPPGAKALRLVPVEQWPEVPRDDGTDLRSAMDRSLQWFGAPSSRMHFTAEISYEQAQAGVYAMSVLLDEHADGSWGSALRQHFDLYESVGWDMEGTVLYTGYYSPRFEASTQPTDRFRYPLHGRPLQLETDPLTGAVAGWRHPDGRLLPAPTRRQLRDAGALKGLELVWFDRPLNVYLVHVNGSAQLHLPDGRIMHVGYAGTNGHPYTSIGRLLVAEGQISEHQLSLTAISRFFRKHPDRLERYVMRNDRFVFFREVEGNDWPAGSLGFTVEPHRTLATDKAVFPRAGVVMIDTTLTATGRPLRRLMVDQDTGGAIRAPGRADIYFGVGAPAERLAGAQHAEGRLYYFILKPAQVAYWMDRMRASEGGG